MIVRTQAPTRHKNGKKVDKGYTNVHTQTGERCGVDKKEDIKLRVQLQQLQGIPGPTSEREHAHNARASVCDSVCVVRHYDLK